jgi:uncharacterized cupredoxin-like copper-binding protein
MPPRYRCRPHRLPAALVLLALAACAAPPPLAAPAGDRAAAVDWSQARVVEIALDEYAFRPERIILRAGEPVRLRLANTGARAHDFTAPAFFANAATRPGDAAGPALRAAGGSVDVPAGGMREVALLPLAPGTYPLDCDKPLHGMFGMAGEIVVTPPA